MYRRIRIGILGGASPQGSKGLARDPQFTRCRIPWPGVPLALLLSAALLACQGRSDSPTSTNSAINANASSTSERCQHKLPPALCTRCTPALSAVFKAKGDWCTEHSFPESLCPLCRPNSAAAPVRLRPAKQADWCGSHGLPESKCTQCDPSLAEQFRAAGDFCEEHGFPESVCPKCNPQAPPKGAEQAAIEARVVRLRSPDIERLAGIETVAAQLGQASESLECTARIAFNADRIAEIRAIVPGIVSRVRAELGAHVSRGAALFDLKSTRVGEVQGALQSARQTVRAADANLTRVEKLHASKIVSARQVELARQELTNAQSALRTAEASLSMAGALPSEPSGHYSLVAPISGTVVRRPGVVGSLATESESLATVADLSVLWALCEVPAAHASRVAIGQKVLVTLDDRKAAPIAGTLSWIAAEVNPRTRTVAARTSIPNPKGGLRANQFAHARIETSAPHSAVSVPRPAIQRIGQYEVVFVRSAPGTYQPRIVRSSGAGSLVAIEGRVRAGDLVVTNGAVLLRTEILPGSIGAGCCEVQPTGGG